ncbi:MAG: BamA/TamA family outer membrane protein [Longimicrobiales bacterium]
MRTAVFVTALSLAGGSVAAQQGPDSVTVTAGSDYAKSGLFAAFMGEGHRDLWTTPFRVEVANLQTLAGGLTPFRVGGGTTTQTLHLRGADGRRYVMRSVDKSPQVLAEELAGTPVERLLQDQISSFHPTAALIIPPLLEAVGVLHAVPQLVVIPDDPALGEFREQFAGLLALYEERPDDGPDGTAGFAGSERIEGSDEFFELMEDNPRHAVDAVELLKSRLVDILVGDRDRSKNNYLWARFDDPAREGNIWRPIPRDRDQALVEFDGLLKKAYRTIDPRLLDFDPEYSDVVGLTRNAWDIDRTFLVSLSRDEWDATVRDVQARITDEVIREGVGRLPPEHLERTGAFLQDALVQRRDRLHEAADEFYEIVFEYADIHATDEVDTAYIDGDGSTVSVRLESGSQGRERLFERVFDADETKEVRVYLHGDDDLAVIRGERTAIDIRVVGGGGRDHLVDSTTAGGAKNVLYDRGSNTTFETAGHSRIVRATPDHPLYWWDDVHGRDFGRTSAPRPVVSFDSNRGLVVGYGMKHDKYAFAKVPNSSVTDWRAAWGFGAAQPELSVSQFVRDVREGIDLHMEAAWSGLEIINFHGFGNDTEAPQPRDFYEVDQRLLTLSLAAEIGDADRWVLGFGPVFRFANTDTTRIDGVLATARPYGSGGFSQLGAHTYFSHVRTDRPLHPSRGYRSAAEARVFPGLLGVDEGAFGSLKAEVSAYMSPAGSTPTLAVRLAGEKTLGTAPFHEAAFIGGPNTVRGLSENRYAGDGSLMANTELRVALGQFLFVLPVDFGAFALFDAGRVYVDGESSSTWHTGVGGGVWFTPYLVSTTLRLSMARSEGRNAFYLGLGHPF